MDLCDTLYLTTTEYACFSKCTQSIYQRWIFGSKIQILTRVTTKRSFRTTISEHNEFTIISIKVGQSYDIKYLEI